MTRRVVTPTDLREACEVARASGKRVGLVPTMGALHAGHLSLVEAAREGGADFIVVTIFVNPLQFGPEDDFERYPRLLEEDESKCREAGVDLVFAPSPDAMYPAGHSTTVVVRGVSAPLEGEYRPGHFDGVATVVTKLFGLVGQCVAVFGRKDFQQLQLIRRFTADLNLPIEIVGAPIVREADGLALSSRNRYLTTRERERALGLVRGLRTAWDAFAAGERTPERLVALARGPIEAAVDSLDYLALADPSHLGPPDTPDRVLLAVAAHLGETRLIDNVVLGEDPRP